MSEGRPTDERQALWAGAITRSSSFRYGFAFALSLLGLIGASVLLSLDETPFYALLIGCVAVSIWYGGLGPGLVTMFVSFPSASLSVSLVTPRAGASKRAGHAFAHAAFRAPIGETAKEVGAHALRNVSAL